jgi:hypothetical protein
VAKASCSGKWSGGSYGASGSYSVSATAKYGELTGRAVSKVKATEATGQSTYSDTQPTQFVDMLSFPTLPDGTLATLSATVQLTGVSSVSNASSSSQVQAYEFLGSSSSCSIEAVGTCTTSIPWEGGGGSAEFHLSLLVNAFAELDATGSASASGDYQAKITALTMTDANGITYEIVAASGHKYPK